MITVRTPQLICVDACDPDKHVVHAMLRSNLAGNEGPAQMEFDAASDKLNAFGSSRKEMPPPVEPTPVDRFGLKAPLRATEGLNR